MRSVIFFFFFYKNFNFLIQIFFKFISPHITKKKCTELKLKMLHFYNLSLDERYRVRNVIIENDLVEWRKNEGIIKKKQKFHREMIQKMRPFIQVVGKEKHDSIIEGFLEEHNLRKKIEQFLESKKGFNKSSENTSEKHKLDDSYNGLNSSLDSPPLHKKQRKSSMIDILNAPYSQLLTSNEKDLCAKNKLSPSQYILIKQAFISHCLKTDGSISREEAHQLCKLDVIKVDKIYDFFENSGWSKKKKKKFFTKKLTKKKNIVNKKYSNTTSKQTITVKNALLSLSRPPQNRLLTTMSSPFPSMNYNK